MNKYKLESTEYYKNSFKNFSRMIILTSIILLIIVLLLFSVLPHESVLKLKGQIEPVDRIEAIQINPGLELKQKYYFEGQKVKQGQILATYSEAKNRIVKMKAKQSGLVHLDFFKKAKQITEVIEIYPKLGVNKKVKIIAFVPSNNISLVKKGQELILNIKQSESVATSIFGKINTVGIKSITIDHNDFYLVEAQTKLSSKQAKIIRYGMKGDASIIVKKGNSLPYFINQLLRKIKKAVLYAKN